MYCSTIDDICFFILKFILLLFYLHDRKRHSSITVVKFIKTLKIKPRISKFKQITSHSYVNLIRAAIFIVNLERMVLMQKRLVRVITCPHYRAHTEPLMLANRLLSLQDNYVTQKQIIFMYHSADFRYEDLVLRYMDLKCGIHFRHTLRNRRL